MNTFSAAMETERLAFQYHYYLISKPSGQYKWQSD